MVINIEEKIFPSKKYIGMKQTVKFEDISNQEIYAKAYAELGKYFAEKGIVPSGPAAVVYFTWDMATQTSEMAPSFPVSDVNECDSEVLEIFEVPESGAVVAHHEGDYATLKDAHDEMMAYINEHGVEMGGFAVEEYLVDPNLETDSSKWKTDIWYFKK